MGDKTQLLAFILASRYRKPWPILLGIFLATIANHSLAAAFGQWLSGLVAPTTLKWILALSFFGFGLWMLIPDKEDGLDQSSRFGPFLASFILFFLAEMGDKTQLATVALAAKYQNLISVTIGTTLGMMLADGAPVFLGDRITRYLPFKLLRFIAAALFMATAILLLF